MATGSQYSHMGIIYEKDGAYYVFEAIQPVQFTPLKLWMKRGENEHYVSKRLINSDSVLTSEAINKLKNVGEKFIGKNYDIYFGWSDERIYCSELVWKIYKEAIGIEIGSVQTLKEFNLTSEEVKAKLKERYGNNIPMNEVVISPVAIFNDKRLIVTSTTPINH